MATYEAGLRQAGFTDVLAQDLRGEAIDVHGRELNAFTAAKEAFIRDFSEEQYDTISNLWADKVSRVATHTHTHTQPSLLHEPN